MTSVLIRNRGRGKHRDEGHAKTETETEESQPQAQQSHRPPEAGRGQKQNIPRASGGRPALQMPGYQASGLQNCEQNTPADLNHLVHGFVAAATGNYYSSKELPCPLLVTRSWKDAAGRVCPRPRLCQTLLVTFLCKNIQHLPSGGSPLNLVGGRVEVQWRRDPHSISWAQPQGSREPVTLRTNADRL